MPGLCSRLRNVAGALLAITAVAGYASAAGALTAGKNEEAELKACQKRFCDIVVGRQKQGPDLSCALAMTWSGSEIKKGGKQSSVSWLFGDAQCRLDVTMARATIIGALTTRKFNIRMPLQTVNCKVERSKQVLPVVITAAPKLKFKNGKAKLLELRVKSVDGPSDVTAMIWTVVKLHENMGLFRKPMLKGINKFLRRKCLKIVYGKAKARIMLGKEAKAKAAGK